jgi:hypothetical protein
MATHSELPPPANEPTLVPDASRKNYQQSGQQGLVRMAGVSLNFAITISEHQELAEQVSETPADAAYTRSRLTTIHSLASIASPSPLEPWKMSLRVCHVKASWNRSVKPSCIQLSTHRRRLLTPRRVSLLPDHQNLRCSMTTEARPATRVRTLLYNCPLLVRPFLTRSISILHAFFSRDRLHPDYQNLRCRLATEAPPATRVRTLLCNCPLLVRPFLRRSNNILHAFFSRDRLLQQSQRTFIGPYPAREPFLCSQLRSGVPCGTTVARLR